MLFRFPSLEALRLALTSGAVPAEEAGQPVQAAWGEAGEIFVLPGAPLPRGVPTRLKELGAGESRRSDLALERFENWLQLVPLLRREPIEVGDKTVVLFDIRRTEQLAEIVAEILRLGNDRQGFRQLQSGHHSRTLLRVVGPPYYALLRALETQSNDQDRFHCGAFYEQRPRVWVELGQQHPLAERITPPPGKWLLLTAPRNWETIDEAPFQDVYSVTEFKLPTTDSAWHDQPLEARFTVPLRLTNSAATDPAELWVLRDDAWQQVEQLVGSSDNELLTRLSFAVAEVEGRSLVVLRTRPSKLSPPVLVLRGVACRSYLKLPNLFVPVGRRLHPPLRRDAVARLLTLDAAQIVWLDPQEGHAFQPLSLPDAAFRPLTQWVDYVLDSQHEALAAWRSAHRFDFEGFVCADDAPARPKPPPRSQSEKKDRRETSETSERKLATTGDEEPVLAELIQPHEAKFALNLPSLRPSELQQRLTAAEKRFAALEAPIDDPARRPLWREMAQLNGALERPLDASLCWTQTGWEQSDWSPLDLENWLRDVSDDTRGPTRKPARSDAVADLPTSTELKRLIDDPQTNRTPVLRLAVQLVRLAGKMPALQQDRLSLAARALERQEGLLPVRLAWLAWVALARLAHNDALLLARARDRTLERLFNQGLTLERDVPGFLRSGGGSDRGRQNVLREHLLALRELIAEWTTSAGQLTRPLTRPYADMLIAFGLTSLGETAEAQRIMAWVKQQLGTKDAIHNWAVKAYEFRIGQATQASKHPSLPPELLAALDRMNRDDRYKIDRLRQRSRVIEPLERVQPYRKWHGRYTSDLDRELARLVDLTDRAELQAALNGLLNQPPPEARTPELRLRILTTSLELSPRLGAEFAANLLGQVMPAWNAATDTIDRAMLLEKALQIAAHFDQREAVQAFVERFDASLGDIVQTYMSLQTMQLPQQQERLTLIESLFEQSFRGLRKLGLRDEITRIFARVVERVEHEERAAKAARKGKRDDATRAGKLLLTVAGGWFHFGQHDLARPVIQNVRRQLFTETIPVLPKASLACAYVSAVGQAPLEVAWPLIQELFSNHASGKKNLDGVVDSLVTSSHFSLPQLDIVEATILTLVSDAFVLSRETQLWLEEDEFLVRRRIHRDVREMMAAS